MEAAVSLNVRSVLCFVLDSRFAFFLQLTKNAIIRQKMKVFSWIIGLESWKLVLVKVDFS